MNIAIRKNWFGQLVGDSRWALPAHGRFTPRTIQLDGYGDKPSYYTSSRFGTWDTESCVRVNLLFGIIGFELGEFSSEIFLFGIIWQHTVCYRVDIHA